jgi:long-chain acyl-CoA synthetase
MSATASTSKLNLLDQNYFGAGSVEVSPPKEGEGGVRRLAICKDRLLTEPAPEVKVVPDVLDYAAKKYGDVRAVGWRDVVDVHKEEKKVKKMVDGEEREETKTWSYFELSDPKYLTFSEYRMATREVGRALAHLGFGKPDDVVAIYAATRLVGSGLCSQE